MSFNGSRAISNENFSLKGVEAWIEGLDNYFIERMNPRTNESDLGDPYLIYFAMGLITPSDCCGFN